MRDPVHEAMYLGEIGSNKCSKPEGSGRSGMYKYLYIFTYTYVSSAEFSLQVTSSLYIATTYLRLEIPLLNIELQSYC
jgi:hypothetical protein